MNEAPLAFLDFETRSKADLKVVGGYNYANDPSTEVLCGCAKIDGVSYAWCSHADVVVEGADFTTREMPLAVKNHSGKFVAHNAQGFDQYIWEALGYPEKEWIDTLPLTRANSLPGSLGKAATFLWNEGKDDGGKIMLKLCKPNRKGKFFPLNSQNTSVVTRYCLKDVELMERLMPVLVNQEPELLEVDRQINQRGFKFDAVLAERLIACDAVNRKQAVDNCLLDSDQLRSNKQLMEWLETQEVYLPNLQKGTINNYLNDEYVLPHVRDVLDARLGATKITSAKVQRALGLMGGDGRVRNCLAFHAAHTGRWGGRGFQPQNLPRGVKCDVDRLVSETLAGYQPNDGELSTLIRACVLGPLTVVDYSQIEVRVLAWLAGQQSVLDSFERGEDIYVNMAAEVYGCTDVTPEQRNVVGKPLILGCGFGLGHKTFELFGAGYGLDFEAVGFTSQELVDKYRDAHPLIAGVDTGREYKGHKIREGGFWKDLGKAFMAVTSCEELEAHVGRLRIQRIGDDVLIHLPSGRYLRYRQATIEMRVPGWGGDPKPTATYMSNRGIRIPTYGGKLAENVTQAVARDVLGYAMINVDKAGYNIVLHVHDEMLVETQDYAIVADIMKQVPPWAEGLPLDVDGSVMGRYRK